MTDAIRTAPKPAPRTATELSAWGRHANRRPHARRSMAVGAGTGEPEMSKPAGTTCTITDAFFGIPGDPCGQPATGAMVATCADGHEEQTPICRWHSEGLGLTGLDLEVPSMRCAPCAERGQSSPAAIALAVTA